MPLEIDLSKNAVIKDFLRQERAEGKAEGRVEGKAEGRAEGKAEGKRDALRNLLPQLLEVRFGAVPKWVSARLETASLSELEHLARNSSTAPSLEALFAASEMSPQRRKVPLPARRHRT